MSEETEQFTTTTNTAPLPLTEITISPLAEEIAGQLGETESGPIRLVQIVIDKLGENVAREFAAAAVNKQAEGGMFLKKLDRKRTTGGIFFYWARGKIGNKEWTKFSPHPPFEKKKSPKPQPDNTSLTGAATPSARPTTSAKAKAQAPLITDAELSALYTEASTWSAGSANTTKLTLIGRPDKVTLAGGGGKGDTSAGYAAFTLEMSKVPELPKGLPTPQTNTKYLALLALKQWRKAEIDLKTSETNRLMIEAYLVINAKVVAGIVAAGISVLINQAVAKEDKKVVTPPAGVATTTKLVLIGRPGEVKRVKDACFFVMEANKVPALPAGLPPITPGTKYLVQVAAKQWKNVENAITRDEQDRLVVDGYPSFDPRFPGGVIVSVMNITTVAQARAKREQQQPGAATVNSPS